MSQPDPKSKYPSHIVGADDMSSDQKKALARAHLVSDIADRDGTMFIPGRLGAYEVVFVAKTVDLGPEVPQGEMRRAQVDVIGCYFGPRAFVTALADKAIRLNKGTAADVVDTHAGNKVVGTIDADPLDPSDHDTH